MIDRQRAPWWIDMAASLIQRLPASRYRAMNWVGERHADPFWARMPAASDAPGILRMQEYAAGDMDVTSALTPLTDADDLGSWPHLLWT